jgi:hypothetical protein
MARVEAYQKQLDQRALDLVRDEQWIEDEVSRLKGEESWLAAWKEELEAAASRELPEQLAPYWKWLGRREAELGTWEEELIAREEDLSDWSENLSQRWAEMYAANTADAFAAAVLEWHDLRAEEETQP